MFESWASGNEKDKTESWTETKVKGLLQEAWKENIARYTRHTNEFDEILAAAAQYRVDHGGHPKSRAAPSQSASKFITRLAPPSSDVEQPSDAAGSSSDEDSG